MVFGMLAYIKFWISYCIFVLVLRVTPFSSIQILQDCVILGPLLNFWLDLYIISCISSCNNCSDGVIWNCLLRALLHLIALYSPSLLVMYLSDACFYVYVYHFSIILSSGNCLSNSSMSVCSLCRLPLFVVCMVFWLFYDLFPFPGSTSIATLWWHAISTTLPVSVFWLSL